MVHPLIKKKYFNPLVRELLLTQVNKHLSYFIAFNKHDKLKKKIGPVRFQLMLIKKKKKQIDTPILNSRL